MPLVAIIESHGLVKPTRKQHKTRQCRHCKNWFAPGGFATHTKHCANKQRPQRHYERPDYLRLMGDSL